MAAPLATKIIITVASQKAMKGLAAFGRGLKSVTSSIFSMRTALVGLAGAAGFGFLVKRSLNATDALAKTASKIGTTTEALSKLQYAAQITGVEQNTLNMALQRFTRRAAEAAKGTGEAKGALRELGVDANKLQKIPLDQQMAVLADAFGNVKTESDKLRLAFKLFDSEGAALVNTLALGRDGLEDLFGRAKALGLVMSADAAAGVEKANDALTDMFAVARGLFSQFTAALAPAIETIANKMTDFATKTADAEGGIEKFAQNMAKAFLQSVKAVVSAMQTVLGAVDNTINAITEKVNSVRISVLEEQAQYAKRNAALFAEAYKVIAGGGSLSGQQSLKLFLKGVGTDLESLRQAYVAAAGDAEMAMSDIMLLQDGSSPLNISGMLDFDAAFANIDELIEAIGKIPAKVANIKQPVTDSVNNMAEGFKKWSDTLPSVDQALQDLTKTSLDGLTQAMTDGITGAKSFADAFRNMASQVVNSLIKMFIQYKIVEPLFQTLFGSSPAGGSSTPTGSMSTMNNASMTAGGFGNASSGMFTPRAIGGSVQAGQPYMVGERGMEMFVPNQSGAIVPNNRLAGSGVVINQSINISTGVAQTVRAEITGLMPQITEATKSAVADARMRGGSYSQALMGG